ncbi:biotin--[acetyl-CoA-carboxylase] ligase [Flavobacterium gawalongense]|uniref:Biotin--[acetyl-CoA-carboxylase] ligase n=1 Tax=Flavobacterium gawalongense TaxID=2594432 RepID=A0A553BV97_9FLAO|nr:biotin--[acetyl-CoA-carboxylase] ligase [Flavobacterium gawalongense]TRX02738.1 biotin--[acetyl-CoA-carboxylase] ligase [Flavobacterium gawalongense]TRX08046.1 biotin--[acetyl-CoA-carboxylase] ligase [Flavobacterium gawalongense]TRX10917.1 biotin--[acetyl-CoA-carboxylase] ligase [Flavobacterium gawalongense]TRX12163.1 biotin--[acetyl-CoA-carboxylase] ligase [Flavobacterium gawalongense]TRX25169.1 biotin--[acetyl-CoA-carboxylase] ligase [Flavobacterium gawalongense]
MKVIKLDAIDSTNEFLKGLSNKQELENFTVVTAESQTKGKGQMGAVWASEASKNLIMSVLIKGFLSDICQIYNLNIAVSLAVIEVLETSKIPDLSIKWPNDIMSYNKKIGGILIENSIKSDGSIISIVGLGLNVNQTNFENLPKASSLAAICNTKFDKEELLFSIMDKIENNVKLWEQKSNFLWSNYTDKLFKKAVPMPFSNQNNQNFMGIIQGVSSVGKLQVLLEDDSISEFDIKEIQMLY